MKQRLIQRIINRLLKWSFKIHPKATQEEYLQKTDEVIQGLYSTYNPMFDSTQFDRDIFKILFNVKYRNSESTEVPSELLNRFYEQAKEGKHTFLRHPFFRLLRVNKDREVKKLLHILDRNTK
jgi:hypothetical protein